MTIDERIEQLQRMKANGATHVAMVILTEDDFLYGFQVGDELDAIFGDEGDKETEAKREFAKRVWHYFSDAVEDRLHGYLFDDNSAVWDMIDGVANADAFAEDYADEIMEIQVKEYMKKTGETDLDVAKTAVFLGAMKAVKN